MNFQGSGHLHIPARQLEIYNNSYQVVLQESLICLVSSSVWGGLPLSDFAIRGLLSQILTTIGFLSISTFKKYSICMFSFYWQTKSNSLWRNANKKINIKK
jgi:hypothetical protein